jgi:hypothetical protein
MKRPRKRGILILAALAVATWYAVRIDGSLRPVSRAATVTLENATLMTPALVRSDADPNAVYAVLDGPRPDGRFPAARIDVRTGAQTPAAIPLGPTSGFSPFLEGGAELELAGLSLRRPAFHLFRLPDGRGPGFRLVDSDTGLMRLTTSRGPHKRTLLKRWVFNSSSSDELRSQVSTDTSGRTIAVVSRSRGRWLLHLFDTRLPEES